MKTSAHSVVSCNYKFYFRSNNIITP